jgi:hypothetical protein
MDESTSIQNIEERSNRHLRSGADVTLHAVGFVRHELKLAYDKASHKAVLTYHPVLIITRIAKGCCSFKNYFS